MAATTSATARSLGLAGARACRGNKASSADPDACDPDSSPAAPSWEGAMTSSMLMVTSAALGWDSFQIGAGLGLVPPSWRRLTCWCVLLGICDGLAAWLGLSIGWVLH